MNNERVVVTFGTVRIEIEPAEDGAKLVHVGSVFGGLLQSVMVPMVLPTIMNSLDHMIFDPKLETDSDPLTPDPEAVVFQIDLDRDRSLECEATGDGDV